MAKAFEFRDVVKTYPGFTLGPLDVDLEPGTVLGYVGPNGAGKTTTMHCLVGLVKANRGEMRVFGRPNDPDHPEWRHDLGYVGDEHVFAEACTGEEHLQFLSQFYPRWSTERANDLAKRFTLPLNKPAKSLSRGNRVKLSLVAALAYSPKLLLLDEPTSGLDPVVRSEVLDVLFDVMADGESAIFYSTHILADISRLADDLAFLDNGRIKLRAAKEDLTEQWRRISFRLPHNDLRLAAVVSHKHEGRDHQIVSRDRAATIAQLGELGAADVVEQSMSIDEITMLSQNGLTLGGISIFVIHTNLGFYETRTYHRLCYAFYFSAALLVAGLIYARHMDDVVRFLWSHYVSVSGAVVSTALWLGLWYVSVVTYVRRRSYLA